MNEDNSVNEELEMACECGVMEKLADEYIIFCRSYSESDKSTEDSSAKKKDKNERFPNIAGFCRYFGIGRDKYERLSKKYPEEFELLSAIFEDEALNSKISPSIVMAYLKRRLGYSDTDSSESSRESEIEAGQLTLVFDHDIFKDGE